MTPEEAQKLIDNVNRGKKSKTSPLSSPEMNLKPEKDSLPKKLKYRNKKVVVDNIKFDSIKESKRYLELKDLKANNKISGFERQVRIPLIVNNVKVCSLVIDFKIYDNSGIATFEDVKGWSKKEGKFLVTPDCRIKHKLFEALFNQKIILK